MTPIRCALYTRKSSAAGLEQPFNSLEAQREACAAYVRSQAGEGWRSLAARYDDGAVSGASLERPALRRLLADLGAGRLEVVVVYKIDRLTRSLADFARLVELFERHRVSFVSVTQAFDTTSSVGRLTLNVLLSFAQFEREVTGERIRDKIAASKARGLWLGGTLPLGYDAPGAGSARGLVVKPEEAETVRTIFRSYLELGSVHAVVRRLAARGLRTKRRVSRAGRVHGGCSFNRGALFHLLRNRTYLGLTVHKGTAHPGLHPAIVEAELFDAVQARLDGNRRRRVAGGERVARAPLAGRVFDAAGAAMSPTFTRGARGKLYRYYVSAPLQQGARASSGGVAVRRLPGAALEARITAIVDRLTGHTTGAPLGVPGRIEVRKDGLQLLMPVKYLAAARSRLLDGERAARDTADPSQLRLSVPLGIHRRDVRTWIRGGAPPAAGPDPGLIEALRAAHVLVPRDAAGLPRLDAAPASPRRRRLVRLAFLAPALQDAILAGRQPPGLTLAALMAGDIPPSWQEQLRRWGAPPPDRV